MEKYNYKENICEDIRNYINDNVAMSVYEDKEEAYEALYDVLWIEDSVTGNASGSYTFNTWEAEENLCHNQDLLQEAMEEFCCTPNDYKGAEWADVTIRCYLLSECLSDVLDDVEF